MEPGKILWWLSTQFKMKEMITRSKNPFPSFKTFSVTMLFFRIAVTLEIMMVHGLKKLGVGTQDAESIPNPFHLSQAINDGFIITANLFFPFLVLIGFYTRISTLPTLAVTLTGYLFVHGNDALIVRDVPYMYSVSFLLIFLLGPGKYSIDYFINKNTHQFCKHFSYFF